MVKVSKSEQTITKLIIVYLKYNKRNSFHRYVFSASAQMLIFLRIFWLSFFPKFQLSFQREFLNNIMRSQGPYHDPNNPIPRSDTYSLRSSQTFSSHLCLPSDHFSIGLPVKILKGLLLYSILAKCPAHLKYSAVNHPDCIRWTVQTMKPSPVHWAKGQEIQAVMWGIPLRQVAPASVLPCLSSVIANVAIILKSMSPA